MKPSTVNIFGNFGTQNLGNECTLQAVIHNVRQYLHRSRRHLETVQRPGGGDVVHVCAP